MKFNVGDLIRLDKIRPRPHIYPHPHLHLINTYGIIISAEKHNEIFEKDSTDDDNGYVWLSQIEQKEYYFYENELIKYETCENNK